MEKLNFSKFDYDKSSGAPWTLYTDTLSREDIIEGRYDKSVLVRSPEEFELSEQDYSIFRNIQEFTNQKRADGANVMRDLKIEEAASLMVGLTQKLIYNINGIHEDKPRSDNNKAHEDESQLDDSEARKGEPYPDEIIYLDKSARPVSWLVNTFWDDFASKDENGIVRKRPHHSYINVDRVHILKSFFGAEGSEGNLKINGMRYDSPAEAWGIYKKELTKKDFAQLRALYVDPEKISEDTTLEQIMEIPSRLDGKNILIVDEVIGRGTSIDMAKTFLEGAFPGCKVRRAIFWHQSAVESIPPWYNNKKVEGRGIGDVDPPYFNDLYDLYSNIDYFTDLGLDEKTAELAKNKAVHRALAKRIGSKLLSAPLNLETEKGQLSRKLAKDIVQLHKDYLAHKIVPFFDNDRDYVDEYCIDMIKKQGIAPENLASLKTAVFK